MNIKKKYLNWKNAENPAPVSVRNILRVVEAYWRKWFPLTPKHIEEQVKYRMTLINPLCRNQKSCIKCGCSIPELLYSDDPCDGFCYPRMLDKKAWKFFKKFNNIKL